MNHQSSTDSNSALADLDSISRRAYELWEKEGRPEGSDLRHWLQAEQELGANSHSSNDATSNDTAMSSNQTSTDVRPLDGTRAASAANRSPKRGSNPPFGERNSQAGMNSQSSSRRK